MFEEFIAWSKQLESRSQAISALANGKSPRTVLVKIQDRIAVDKASAEAQAADWRLVEAKALLREATTMP